MNPKRSLLSSSQFSFGPETQVIFKTVFDHYRIGTPSSLMSVDAYGDECGLKIGEERVSSWAQLPQADDLRWRNDQKPFDEPILALYRDETGYRYVIEFRIFKNRKAASPVEPPACFGWMHPEEAFRKNKITASNILKSLTGFVSRQHKWRLN